MLIKIKEEDTEEVKEEGFVRTRETEVLSCNYVIVVVLQTIKNDAVTDAMVVANVVAEEVIL